MIFNNYKLKLAVLGCIMLIHPLNSPSNSKTDEKNKKSGKVAVVQQSPDEQWTQYRGPNRDGVSHSKTAIKSWSGGGEPKLVWKHKIGDGFSGIVIDGEQFITAFAEDSTEFIAGFKRATGEENWRASLGKMFVEEFGNGPRATPTIDGNLGYIFNSFGQLYCVNIKTGKQVWMVPLNEKFKIKQPQRGFTTSPLIMENNVVIHAGGGKDAAFIGLNKKTGEITWKSGDSMVSHSSPFMAVINNVEQSIFTATRVIEKDGKKQGFQETVSVSGDGKILWRGPALAGIVAMPVFVPPDKVFISSSLEDGCQLMQILPGATDPGLEIVWHNKEMKNHFNSSVYYKDHIYGFSNSTLICLVAATAERKWSKRRYGKGCLIIADDKLLILSDRGKLIIAEATGKGYNELGQLQVLKGKSWTSPTYANGKIYLRNREEMACYDLTK